MSIEKIKSWLEKEENEFSEGLNLFVEHSKNRSLFLYLSRKQDRSKLEYELRKLAGEFNPKPIAPQDKEQEQTPAEEIKESPLKSETPEDEPPKVEPPKSEITTAESQMNVNASGKKIAREDLPENLQIVYDTIVEAYRTQRSFHEKMKLAIADAERESLRAEVVRCDDIVTEGWNKIDSFVEGKTQKVTLEVKAEIKPDPLSIGKEINACRKFISINIPKLGTLEGISRDELKAKIKDRYNTLVNLKVEIKADTRDQLAKAGII